MSRIVERDFAAERVNDNGEEAATSLPTYQAATETPYRGAPGVIEALILAPPSSYSMLPR